MPLNCSERSTATDILHGVSISDPYRWLEDRQLPETDAWIKNQNRTFEQYFESKSCLPEYRDRVRRHLPVESYEEPVRTAGRLFYRRRQEEHSSICVIDADKQRERVLLDSSIYGPSASVSIHAVSHDGSLLAYELRTTGTDTAEIHLLNSITGVMLPDTLPSGLSRGFSFDGEGDGFYYSRQPLDGSRDHSIRYHSMGTPSEQDLELFRTPQASGSNLGLLADDHHFAAVYSRFIDGERLVDIYLAERARPNDWVSMAQVQTGLYAPYLHCGRIFLLTDSNAPNGQLAELRCADGFTSVIVPASQKLIQDILFVGGSVYVAYADRFSTSIEEWSLQGEFLGEVALPESVVMPSVKLIAQPCIDHACFLSIQSPVHPPNIFEHITGEPELRPVFPEASGAVPPLHVKQTAYHSFDGREVPVALLKSSSHRVSQPSPVLLVSYGGFGVSSTPHFSVAIAILLEAGVIVAIPGIRGGSELGKEWHRSSLREDRQAGFNDFLAAAEWLIAESIADPGRLALYGGSNGGLLVAVAMTQRPDLFCCVVCMGPLLDMVRYERFDRAATWVSEYGSIANPREFAALYAYSPYHHIAEDTNFPPTLFVTGDADDRCNPAHVRKMVARLLGRSAQRSPVLVDYLPERGHRSGLNYTLRREAIARRVTFLCRELAVDQKRGDGS
ncbi:prolyl oligopeptidase family serine peptidase [Edaphobacter dinghuensis]|uniref:prolyl oligopeptidase family serine peptidase n=1 Tax=Edaphobacter dinghuensis TaxID=1560005 RepID=UPI00166B5355|nr:prolyl oligopeptidase family serine peptidase [Edaphobacter dinghuensis]